MKRKQPPTPIISFAMAAILVTLVSIAEIAIVFLLAGAVEWCSLELHAEARAGAISYGVALGILLALNYRHSPSRLLGNYLTSRSR